ncbi:guanylate kinase [Magnaporthiopsis poae ATCC 64411]|uniref:Guanylate kinase n=1 Tax=Magnaporthiopsis poae (strain ATCC 64411 / 73-15) TaxID=644358 RepID=A0A0C4E670_MAGP6|nr:guanylate kinase [Magnaporthiopsis poae ATCC 64411]
MPSIEVATHGIQAVADIGVVLVDLLRHAESVKLTAAIEPPLEKSDFGDLYGHLTRVLPPLESDSPLSMRTRQYGIIETAVRDIFGKLVATTSIESPEFVRVWNLLDLVSILSDMRQCDPVLLFWLVEELLDSQTTSGCRRVLDFLESRHQRITANPSVAMQLTILRSCNELLRRLSRARDTTFCGRVFIFMFQSFPLGDRSSVNLRGEYHVENVTKFDQDPERNGALDKMEIDDRTDDPTSSEAKPSATRPNAVDESIRRDMDALYPVFWSLQASFSQPKKLFDRSHFERFKSGLESTMAAFKDAQTRQISRSQRQEEDPRPGQKRKHEGEGADLTDAFNPKYLTSRDLFRLELSDLTFRRYILVQALIIMEFLLSLSAQEREIAAVASAPNKSVIYLDQQLSKEDTEWADKTRLAIIGHLENSGAGPNEGAYFVRIVKTILARDKNWVRWKAYACSPIEMPPMPPQVFADAKTSACRSATSKRLRATPMNSLSIDFLSDSRDSSGLAKFKPAERYRVPDVSAFKRAIAEDELEIDMPTNSQTKAAAVEGKASKSWRALRVASRSRLAVFDKVEDPDRIDLIFEEAAAQHSANESDRSPAGVRPDDCHPLILSGPEGVGKSALLQLLLERNPGVFGLVPRHTTKPRPDGDEGPNRAIQILVDAAAFGTLIDGDHFLESSEVDGAKYGTSRREAEKISQSGKIPIMEMSLDGARQSKETSYAARHVLVRPHDMTALQRQLEGRGVPGEKIADMIAASKADVERAEAESMHDEVIIGEDLENAYAALERFVYGHGQSSPG